MFRRGDKAVDRLDHIIQLRLRQSRESPNEDRLIHQVVGPLRIADDAERSVGEHAVARFVLLAERHECRLTEQIAAEQSAVADLGCIQPAGKIEPREGSVRLDVHHEAECLALAGKAATKM